MLKLIMVLGAILGMSAVIAGAMGEHELKSKLSEEHANRLVQSYPVAAGAEAETPTEESDGESEEAISEEVGTEETDTEETDTEEADTEEADTDAEDEAEDEAVQTDTDEYVVDPASDDASELDTDTSKQTAAANSTFNADKEKRLSIFRIAVKYQTYNAFGILFVTLLGSVSLRGKGTAVLSGLAFIIGTVMFCGPMYIKAYYQIIEYGYLTPIGGIVILLGWGMLLLATVQFKFDKEESA